MTELTEIKMSGKSYDKGRVTEIKMSAKSYDK